MISFFRSVIAFAFSLVLTVLTFGRVELNRSGKATAEDDAEPERAAHSQPLESPSNDRDKTDAD